MLLEAMALSVQFSSVTQSCPTHCNPMNRCTPGLPVHHQIPEFTHTVKGYGIVNKAEIDELSCFFNDPADVGNLISGSSAFLKPA